MVIAPTRRVRQLPPALLVLTGATVVLIAAEFVAAAATGTLSAAPVDSVVFSIAMTALVLAGLRTARRFGDPGLGAVMLGVAATGALFNLLGELNGFGLAGFVQGVLYWPYAALLAHLILRWPDARVRGRVPRLLLVALWIVLPLLTLMWQLTWDPAWFETVEPGTSWVTLVPAQTFSYAAFETQQLVFFAAILALLGVVASRIGRAHGRRRRALVPVGIAAGFLGLTVVLELLVSLDAIVPIDFALLQSFALLAIPVAVLLRPAGAVEDDEEAPTPLARVRERYTGVLVLIVVGAVLCTIAIVVSVRETGFSGVEPTVPAPGPVPMAN